MDPADKVAADGPEKEMLRGPGLLESMSTQRHSLGFYTAICCTARFSLASRTDNALNMPSIPTLSLVYTALHEVIAQHPPLSVSIEDEASPSARFVRLSSINLERLVHVQDLPAGADEVTRQRLLNELIESRLSSRFSDLGVLPLWRLVVFLPDSRDADTSAGVDIALFVHHGIADGGSAVMFMQTLLTALNTASTRQPEEPLGAVVSPPKSTFLRPVEELHALPISFISLLYAIWRMWFPASRVGLWTGEPISRPSNVLSNVVQTRHAIRVFSVETVTNLLAVCRAHKATITPLLEALVARALFASLPTDGSANLLKASCPINLRAFLPEQKNAMGVYVASGEHDFKRGDADVWREAKRAGSSLARVLGDMKKGKHFNVGMLRYVGDMREYLEGKVGKPRDHSFEVSNTGAVDGSGGEQGPWRMSQLLFSQSGNITGAAVAFSVSSVRGGPMTISASWVEGVVDESVVDATFDKLVSLVEGVCSEKL
ncbi:hypothetical protein PENSPDRAFT_681958 [Peniophora sp. CONT]|nr:hypothetical protein PENSPDRAFT_681958 [Peniophora sp. CONT]